MPLGLALPTIGTVAYGSYTFGSATETVSIDGRPQWDSSLRTITHMVWTITPKTIIGAIPPTTTDVQIEAIRKQLIKPAQTLVYTDKGFSSVFSINTGQVKDVAFGPKPIRFQWRPIASRHAVEVIWTVEVALPECD